MKRRLSALNLSVDTNNDKSDSSIHRISSSSQIKKEFLVGHAEEQEEEVACELNGSGHPQGKEVAVGM